MPGSPLKRQRQLGRREDGSVIAFPRLTHPRAGLSHAEWRALGPAEKLERLFGMSLNRMAEILSWGPIAELDPPVSTPLRRSPASSGLISARAGLFEKAQHARERQRS